MDIHALTEELQKVSQIYAEKFDIQPDSDWYILKLQEELGELIQSYLMMIGQARKKEKTQEQLVRDFHKEVADVFSHVLLLAKHHHVDLEKEIENKWLVWTKKQE
jgi:NTP pyrophosphatase (non-canonical NTP hydrolase)